ncbi:flagellar biosynthetic protein FliR [Desulfotalea psychrophila]|uniref:Flagellar biosynthetic protein FliR n=1 Tax=Desulfotalea psychrophila (strain LSv54 / DSM 12343) TaxID=177439 RepID=Q3V7H4_DESPS|nr:flagellar biosynthetic protein FliR [Desulfotalea psychrophila]CAG37402.1 related to flagellar biosynthetic protein (FliR) [Desulfotalea psychrophila LSv54]
MDPLLIPIEQFQLFLVVLSRVAGFVGAIPVISSVQSPKQIKIALACSVALVLFPIMSPVIHIKELTMPSFALLIVAEVLVGTTIGFAAKLIFTSIEFGATVIGYQMGFAAANVFDPQTKGQVALISQFQNSFAILIFLAIDGHHIFIHTASISYQFLPPGQFNYSGGAVPYLIELTAHMFQMGIQFSAPVLAVLLLSGLILGILSRVFPQLNVFMLSFPINIGLAFTVISLTLGLLAMLLSREFDQLPERILNILTLLHN